MKKSNSIYSVIVPTLNEANQLPDFIKNIRSVIPNCELIVADGGSSDGTKEIARKEKAVLVSTVKGRGVQCNAGALKATGDVLLFLHVDSRLKQESLALLNNTFLYTEKEVANLTLRFEHSGKRYRLLERLSRLETIFTRFGDQGIIIKKSLYKRFPFPSAPLFEDVIYLRTLRKQTRLYRLPITLNVSIRRFEKLGFYKTHWVNFYLMTAFLIGVSPNKLYNWYYNKR